MVVYGEVVEEGLISEDRHGGEGVTSDEGGGRNDSEDECRVEEVNVGESGMPPRLAPQPQTAVTSKS